MEDTSGRATEEDMELEGDKTRTVCIHHQTSGMRLRPSGEKRGPGLTVQHMEAKKRVRKFL